jgi:hypothetical protein
MLSTKLGYGRPDFAAARFAAAFSAGASFVGLPSGVGRLLSQIGVFFMLRPRVVIDQLIDIFALNLGIAQSRLFYA